MSELETLQAIVADEARSAEEREAAAKHILALQDARVTEETKQPKAPPQPSAKAIDPEMRRMLDELSKDDPEPYLSTHKRCRVCLRHNPKDAAACELCGSAGQWEPVTSHHPTWLPLGRKHRETREHLANLRTYPSPFDAYLIRSAMTKREGDGTRQINAATFVPTQFLLSYEQRCWCKQLLRWIEPGVCVPEPEPDEPEPQAEAVTISTTEAKAKLNPSDLDKVFEYQTWKLKREANGQSATMREWIEETMRKN